VYARTKFRRGRGSWALVPLALGTLALTAACGADAGASAATGSTGPVVSTANTGIGTVLVDSAGKTLYDFSRDTGTASTCDGVCAIDWPPVIAPASLPASLPGVSGELGTTTRGDGSKQLTIAGHPVYTYSGDAQAGQTNGQGLDLNGGEWFAVTPAGSPVSGDAAPQSSMQSSPQYPTY
jgi:predicted lipoprotein with Yx(FWY)xxD motif